MDNNYNSGTTNEELEFEKQSKKIDRTGHKYSEENFRNLPREEQLYLANKHWMNSKEFDKSQVFQFSYSHFSNICKDLGFEKGVLDTRQKPVTSEEKSGSKIFIDHGRREETEIKKITLSKSTVELMDALLSGLSNVEKSKVMDVILTDVLTKKMQEKEEGRFGVFYRPQEEQRIL